MFINAKDFSTPPERGTKQSETEERVYGRNWRENNPPTPPAPHPLLSNLAPPPNALSSPAPKYPQSPLISLLQGLLSHICKYVFFVFLLNTRTKCFLNHNFIPKILRRVSWKVRLGTAKQFFPPRKTKNPLFFIFYLSTIIGLYLSLCFEGSCF